MTLTAMQDVKLQLRKLRRDILQRMGRLPKHPGRVVPPPHVPHFDFSQAPSHADGYSFYAQALRQGPVSFDPSQECWTVLGHSQVMDVLKQAELFSSEYMGPSIDPMLVGSDGSFHRQNRELAVTSMTFITSQLVKGMVNAWMAQFVSAVKTRREFDAVGDFGVPLARELTAAVLGLNKPEVERIVAALGPRRTDLNSPIPGIAKVMADVLADIQKTPREGLFGSLIKTATTRQLLTDEQLVVMMTPLWFAGTVNTTSGLAACVVWLCQPPEIAAELRTNPDKIPHFVSEVLRLETPFQFVARKCVRNVPFAGFEFAENALVRLCLGAANHDPSVFDEPHSLRLDRVPYRHLAFGAGEHVCLGRVLAKTAMETAVYALAHNFQTFEAAAPNAEPDYETSLDLRALRKFDVIVRPTESSA